MERTVAVQNRASPLSSASVQCTRGAGGNKWECWFSKGLLDVGQEHQAACMRLARHRGEAWTQLAESTWSWLRLLGSLGKGMGCFTHQVDRPHRREALSPGSCHTPSSWR
jgi:hypothetical protein